MPSFNTTNLIPPLESLTQRDADFGARVKEKIAEMMKLKDEINEITTSLEEEYWEKNYNDYEKSIKSMDRDSIPERFCEYYVSLSAPLQQKFKELLIDIQIYEATEKVGESLDLSWNYIGRKGKKGLEELEELVKDWNNLTSLHLGHNNIGEMEEKELEILVSNWHNLISLHLGHNNIGRMGEKELEILVRNWSNLRSLNLEWNEIGGMGEKELEILVRNWNNLRSLNLEWNNIGTMERQQFETFITHLSNLPHLQKVDLLYNDFTNEQKAFIREKLGYKAIF